MRVKVSEVMAAARKETMEPLLEVETLSFERSLALARLARKLGEEAQTIQSRIQALRVKHGADEVVGEELEKAGLERRTPESEWPEEVVDALNQRLAPLSKEVDELVAVEIEVNIEPVAIPKDLAGVKPAMLTGLVKFVKVE